MYKTFLQILTALLTLTIAACDLGAVDPSAPASSDIVQAARSAEQVYAVPADLTLAVAYAETRWHTPAQVHDHSHEGDSEANHHPELVGIGGIRPWIEAGLIDALMIELNATDEALHTDPNTGITATAAVLRRLADARGAAPAGLLDWRPVLGDYAGLENELARATYADDIYEYLRRGIAAQTDFGQDVIVGGHDLPLPVDNPDLRSALSAAEYPGARFVSAASTNYSSTRSGNSVRYVIIHTVQGSYAGAVSWFANPQARVSAHYTIRSSDGEITQSVPESGTAYHAGNGFYNRSSIGIEHEGFIENPGRWYTDEMYRSSAALVSHLCDKYGIPKTREHIIGHNEVPHPSIPGRFGGAGGHTDPGSGWDWDRFMNLVRGESAVDYAAIEVYWARQASGSYELRALAPASVTRVEYVVDGFAIGEATRIDGSNFPTSYTFSQETAERQFEVRGYNSEGEQIGLGVGLIDVTDGVGVYIKQMGESLYEIGLERAPEGVHSIEVRADGFLLTDMVSGDDRSERRAVRSSFLQLGPREFQLTTYNADGSVRGHLYRSFTLQ